MLKDWLKKLTIIIAVIFIFAAGYDTFTLMRAYYDADREAENIAEKFSLTLSQTNSIETAKYQTQLIAEQYGYTFEEYEIKPIEVQVKISTRVNGTLLTSRIKQLSSYNYIVAKGVAPTTEIK